MAMKNRGENVGRLKVEMLSVSDIYAASTMKTLFTVDESRVVS